MGSRRHYERPSLAISLLVGRKRGFLFLILPSVERTAVSDVGSKSVCASLRLSREADQIERLNGVSKTREEYQSSILSCSNGRK